MKHLQKGHAASSVKGSLLGGPGKPKLKGKSRSPPSSSSDTKDSLALSIHNPSRKGSHQQADLNQSAREAINWLFETLKMEDGPDRAVYRPRIALSAKQSRHPDHGLLSLFLLRFSREPPGRALDR
jgi:hypothetical protein